MSEKGIEDDEENNNDLKVEPWVEIQQNTFTNWMNDKLKTFDLEVHDLRKELRDGVMLCKLMNALKGKSIGKIRVSSFILYTRGMSVIKSNIAAIAV